MTTPHHHASRDPRLAHDATLGRTVFVAPRRGDRPSDAELAAHGGGCPFCVGNESLTPPAVLRVPAESSAAWRARIVPNRYPVVADAAWSGGTDPADGRPARGVHDVVIESAAHLTSVAALEPAAWREVWDLCRGRLAMLADRDDLAWSTIFKNSGPLAGASLEHLHSQIVALDFVPPFIAAELATLTSPATTAADFPTVIAAARADERVVAETAGVVALVPPAPRQPFETWILPMEADPFFHATTPARVAALAELTHWFVGRLAAVAPGTDYNWWLHQLPHGRAAVRPEVAAAWHWHLEIVPRHGQFAGFELGTGCHITTVPPQESARLLRGD
jgi:UDPglucose--hexose-1-phosphate uridylyltransferase